MTDHDNAGPVRSTFSDDPEMLELVEMFVEDMPERLGQIERCWSEGLTEELGRVAHQLKGASAGYGFASLGEAARELEQRIKLDPEVQLEELRNEYESLIDICSRVTL